MSTHLSVFSRDDTDLGRTHLTFHEIDTGQALLLKCTSLGTDHIKEIQTCAIIRPSVSPWVAPVVPVRKKDGRLCLCIDYRKLNDIKQRDAYLLPRIDNALDNLTHAKWFSPLDLCSGY